MTKFNIILLVVSISSVIIGAMLKILIGPNFFTSAFIGIGTVTLFYAIFKLIHALFKKSKS